MTIDSIAIGPTEGDDLSVSMRGGAEEIMKVLVNGLPREALMQLSQAITRELDDRRISREKESSSL